MKKSLTLEEQLQKELWNLEEMNETFITGSQKFLVATDASDIDYVMMKEDYDAKIYPIIHGQDEIIEEDGSGTGRQDPTSHSSVKFRKYNFILTWTEEQFDAWYITTEMISNNTRLYDIRDKTTRVNLFHDIKMIVYNFLENARLARLEKDTPP
jgi:hypothetical protein